MPKPFVVSLPHTLGKEEARRRLQAGIGKAASQFGAVISIDEEIWSADRLTFKITALKQQASGTVDVYDDHVQLELQLPWLLAGIAHGAQAIIRERGQRLLDKK